MEHPQLELSQFDYHLPAELIAQHPTDRRDASRLLHLDSLGHLHDRHFTDLPQLLRAGDLLVFNDTRVIRARLCGHKTSGGRVQVLVERLTNETHVLAHIRASKAPRPGGTLLLGKCPSAASGDTECFPVEVVARHGELFELRFPAPVMSLLERHGSVPLPPYITHHPSPEDEQRYQTVYASRPGAVAAPTAGLHFDEAMLRRLREHGVRQAWITLHVGAGTFQPVREQDLSRHTMHAERYEVPAETLDLLARTRSQGGRVVAVGTTSVRALEAATDSASGDTRLFITPGYRFRNVDALITNFHLPQSTLLMLVSALAGMEPIRRAYAHAVQSRYRFFSYGDAMFIEPPATP